ncbi:hypothetical protein pb186bvf_014545 [Paramecium bursaria]
MDQTKELQIVCISDTHGSIIPLPEGDILIHCGDFTNVGEGPEIVKFANWMKSLKNQFKHIIVIAGNHDMVLDIDEQERLKPRMRSQKQYDSKEYIQILKESCTYLVNESIIVEGIKIWGSPYSLEFCNWGFQIFPEHAAKLWAQIDQDSDIVVTHGPPKGFGDKVCYNNQNVGDIDLLNRILNIKPKYHLFGHIHEGYGQWEYEGINFINCSINTFKYKPTNKPIVIQFPVKQ